MSSVWIVTEGDYSDNHIVGVFSTKEKAYEYYNAHKEDDVNERYTSFYEPEEYELDKVSIACRAVVTAVKNRKDWNFFVSGVLDKCYQECGYIYEYTKEKKYWITVNYNTNRDVMKKSAQDYLFKYLAEKEGL